MALAYSCTSAWLFLWGRSSYALSQPRTISSLSSLLYSSAQRSCLSWPSPTCPAASKTALLSPKNRLMAYVVPLPSSVKKRYLAGFTDRLLRCDCYDIGNNLYWYGVANYSLTKSSSTLTYPSITMSPHTESATSSPRAIRVFRGRDEYSIESITVF